MKLRIVAFVCNGVSMLPVAAPCEQVEKRDAPADMAEWARAWLGVAAPRPKADG